MSWADRPCVPRFKVGSEAAKHLGVAAPAERPKQSRREGQSDKHQVLIRRLPCCLTLGTYQIQVHHLKQGTGERGMGQRSSDRWTVPLDMNKHLFGVERVASTRERAWFQQQGLADPYKLAADLWQRTGNLEHMQATLFAHVLHFGTNPFAQEMAALGLYQLQQGEVVNLYDAAKRAGG